MDRSRYPGSRGSRASRALEDGSRRSRALQGPGSRGRVPWKPVGKDPGRPLRGPWGTQGPTGPDTPCPRVSSAAREPELAGKASSGIPGRTGHFSRFQVSPRRPPTGPARKTEETAVFRCFPLFPGFRQNQTALAYTSEGAGLFRPKAGTHLTFRFLGL